MPKDDKTRSLAPAMTAEIPIVGTADKRAESTEIGRDTRFKPGNPGPGRPKQLLTTAIRHIMTSEDAEAIARKIIEKAKAGDHKFVETLYSRLEGKPTEYKEIGGPGAFDRAIESVETDALLAMIKEIGRRHGPNETQSHDSDANRT